MFSSADEPLKNKRCTLLLRDGSLVTVHIVQEARELLELVHWLNSAFTVSLVLTVVQHLICAFTTGSILSISGV